MEIKIREQQIIEAAAKGMDDFVQLFTDSIAEAAGGELNAEALEKLSADQITLWGYCILREEVMDGGFIQLIHNGYAPFFFHNPFAKAMEQWGLPELAQLVKKARRLYEPNRDELTKPCTDEEFMSLFERFPKFDDLDDAFVEEEEGFTAAIAEYIDNHIDAFAVVEK